MEHKPSKITLKYEDEASGVTVTHELIDVVQLDDLLMQVSSFLRGAGFSMEGLEPVYTETLEQSTKETPW